MKAYCRKTLLPLILYITSFQLSACAVLPGIWSVSPSTAVEGSTLQVEESSNVITHPLVHPLGGHLAALPRKYTKEKEISMRKFIRHQAHSGQINALSVSRFGDEAYSGGQDGKVVRSRRISTDSGQGLAAIETSTLLSGKRPILALSLSADESKLAISQFSSLVIYDVLKRKILYRLSQIKGRILTLSWDPRGELLAFGLANGDVFIWNVGRGRYAGKNSREALEYYGSSTSPIVALRFHPSGRSFFSAERKGIVSLWQLLRTEEELGLLDEGALIDRKKRGKQKTIAAQVLGPIEDIWLNQKGTMMFVAAGNGAIYRWRIRGAQYDGVLFAGSDSSTSIYGISLSPDHKSYPLLVTSGRGQRMKFWCRYFKVDENDPQYAMYGTTGVNIVKEDPLEPVLETSQLPPELSDDLEGVAAYSENNAEEESQDQLPQGFVGQSSLFKVPVTLLEIGSQSTLLWAAEKTGNLLTFEANSLLNSPRWVKRMGLCLQGLNGGGLYQSQMRTPD